MRSCPWHGSGPWLRPVPGAGTQQSQTPEPPGQGSTAETPAGRARRAPGTEGPATLSRAFYIFIALKFQKTLTGRAKQNKKPPTQKR